MIYSRVRFCAVECLPLPAQLVSHYRVLGPLGSGGMGVVYRAEDTSLRRTVALKFLPHDLPSDLVVNERLRREARLASALNHPNICTVYEVGEDSGEVFIAMEYVDGRPLCEAIRPEGLPLETTLRLGRQLASAMAHDHDRGVVHGDLKPSRFTARSSKRLPIGIRNHLRADGRGQTAGGERLCRLGATYGLSRGVDDE